MLVGVIIVMAAVTLSVVYVEPLADLLHLAPFPAAWWLLVAGGAAGTAWTEVFKHGPPVQPPSTPKPGSGEGPRSGTTAA